MIKPKLLTAIFAVASLLAGATRARCEDLACPIAAPAKIRLNVARGEVRVETDVTLQQVREAAQGRHPGPFVGLYVGVLQYGIEIDDTVRQIAANRICAAPTYVTLIVELDRTIHIPREFADDPCLVSLARDHETKHADADAIALDRFRPLLMSAIGAAVRGNTSIASTSRADTLAVLSKGVQTAVERVLDDIATERRRLDTAVDSPAELERLRTGCDGRAAAMGREPFTTGASSRRLTGGEVGKSLV